MPLEGPFGGPFEGPLKGPLPFKDPFKVSFSSLQTLPVLGFIVEINKPILLLLLYLSGGKGKT